MGDIDFSKGGYGGGPDEELFKFFTKPKMEYWWHFREVLRVSQEVSKYWKLSNGKVLDDEHQKELVALSMINYAVHTSMFEAYLFFDEMSLELNRRISTIRMFEVRRLFKAAYSSLYTGLSALANIICVLLSKKSVWKPTKKDELKNYSVRDAIDIAKSQDCSLQVLLEESRACLEIRNHLDHYWTIWMSIKPGQFFIDENFKKGNIVIRPERELQLNIDAQKRLEFDINLLAHNYNLIYKKLSITNGYLDQYLLEKQWFVDYSDFGEPHNGQRPKP